jgi:hypothetical protein
MKGGITKRIDEALAALDKLELKKALYLTENNPKLERQHQFIQDAAHTCLANRDNKDVCAQAIKEARALVQNTISLPLDDTSLEGLEEFMTEEKTPEEIKPIDTPEPAEPQATPSSFLDKAQKTDDELFEECEECHVALAASRFADICAENREEAGGCALIGHSLENENTEPVDWIKAMIEASENAQGQAKEEMVGTLTELTDYLERRNSPLLKALDKGG